MAPKPKLCKMAMKTMAAKPRVAAKAKAAGVTPMKRKMVKKAALSSVAPSSQPGSPPAGQKSPASDAESHLGSHASVGASCSSLGHYSKDIEALGLAVYEVDDSSKCSMCDKAITDTDYVVLSSRGNSVFKKCGMCNRLQSRVQRTLQKRGDLKDRWGVMSRDQRKAFFQQHHSAMGEDLVMQITQTTKHTFSSSQEIGFATKGDWMDDEDLEKLYKDKPEQLMAIKANSKKMLCPLRGVELHEHITYNSLTNDKQASTISRTIAMQQDTSLKAAKKPKSIASGPKAEPGGPPKLSASAIKKLGALLETIGTLSDAIQTQNEKCTEDVPAKFIDHMQLKLTEMMAFKAEIDVVLELGMGKIVELLLGAKTVMSAAQEALVTVSTITASLEAMM